MYLSFDRMKRLEIVCIKRNSKTLLKLFFLNMQWLVKDKKNKKDTWEKKKIKDVQENVLISISIHLFTTQYQDEQNLSD